MQVRCRQKWGIRQEGSGVYFRRVSPSIQKNAHPEKECASERQKNDSELSFQINEFTEHFINRGDNF